MAFPTGINTEALAKLNNYYLVYYSPLLAVASNRGWDKVLNITSQESYEKRIGQDMRLDHSDKRRSDIFVANVRVFFTDVVEDHLRAYKFLLREFHEVSSKYQSLKSRCDLFKIPIAGTLPHKNAYMSDYAKALEEFGNLDTQRPSLSHYVDDPWHPVLADLTTAVYKVKTLCDAAKTDVEHVSKRWLEVTSLWFAVVAVIIAIIALPAIYGGIQVLFKQRDVTAQKGSVSSEDSSVSTSSR